LIRSSPPFQAVAKNFDLSDIDNQIYDSILEAYTPILQDHVIRTLRQLINRETSESREAHAVGRIAQEVSSDAYMVEISIPALTNRVRIYSRA